MNPLDITSLCIIVFFTVRGLFKGFINELFSLFAIAGGLVFIYFFSKNMNTWIMQKTEINQSFNYLLIFLEFIVLVLIIQKIGKLCSVMFKQLSLGVLNTILGGLFGLIKAVLFLSVCFLLINYICTIEQDLIPQIVKESCSLKLIKNLSFNY